MQSIQFFQDALKQVEALTAGLLSTEAAKEYQSKKVAFETELVEARYLKVPVVGVFSAGKSSFLNVFTQKPNLLPVDTLPETAVAYELYYDTNERVELYREGNRIDSRPLADIKSLPTTPGDVAKVYCNSAVVKGLQERGIILVDMPGIGSGIERHDAAIYHYVQSGTAFVLMVDVEQGALRTSTLVFLQELKLFGQFPAVFLTKTDKKPATEVKQVAEYLEYQLKQVSDVAPNIGTVCAVNGDTTAFAQHLDALNPDALLRLRLGGQAKALVEGVRKDLATRISVRQQDIADVDAQIAALEAEIAKAKQELPEVSNEGDTPQQSTQDVLDSIERALNAKVSDLAAMVARGEGKEDIKSVMVSTIRTALITTLQSESEQYAEAVGNAVQESAKHIAGIKINANILGDFESIINVVKPLLAALPIGGVLARVLTFVLAHLPIVKDVLNWLFGRSDADRRAEAQAKIAQQIPTIVDSLRNDVLKLVSDNQKRIQGAMQDAYVNQLNSVVAGLNDKKADAQKAKDKVEEEIATLQGTVETLTTLVATF